MIRPRLLTIPGVAQVIPIGGEVRQYRVTLNLAQMTRLDVTRGEIEAALRQFGSQHAPAASSTSIRREYLIRNLARTTRLQDLEIPDRCLSQGRRSPARSGRLGRLCGARQTRRRRTHGQSLRHP